MSSTSPLSAITSTSTNRVNNAFNSSTDSKKLEKEYSNFINMFMTQLKYQDPTEPMETHEMTQQIVGLNQVEQAIKTNDKLSSLERLTQTTSMQNSLQYQDQEIEYEGNNFELSNSKGEFMYKIDQNFDKAIQLNILDSKGKTIYSQEIEAIEGMHKFEWNGEDMQTVIQKDGIYTIDLSSINKDGQSVKLPTYVKGTVDSVYFQNDQAQFEINKELVLQDKITALFGSSVINLDNSI